MSYWFSRLSVNSSLQLVIALVHFLKVQGSFPKMPKKLHKALLGLSLPFCDRDHDLLA